MQPSVIIHSAAERRPDVVENNPTGTQQLNIQATEHICQAASKKSDRNILFIYTFLVMILNQRPTSSSKNCMYEFHIRKKKQINFSDKQGNCIDPNSEMYMSRVFKSTVWTVIRFHGIFQSPLVLGFCTSAQIMCLMGLLLHTMKTQSRIL